MQKETKCTVHFRVESRADGGVRVYATDPTGVYVSSRHVYAALEYFQNYIVVAALNRLRPNVGNGGIRMLTGFDWETILLHGAGTCEFCVITRKEIEAGRTHKRAPHKMPGDFPPTIGEQPGIAEIELHTERWPAAPGKVCVVSYDIGEYDPILEDIVRRQETLQ